MYVITFIGNLSGEDKAKGRTQLFTDSALDIMLKEGESVTLDTLPDWAKNENLFTFREVKQ